MKARHEHNTKTQRQNLHTSRPKQEKKGNDTKRLLEISINKLEDLHTKTL